MVANKIVVSLLSALCHLVQSAKILGIFPMAAPSHYILGRALMNGLVEAGHDVTMISPYVQKDPPKNGSYRDVLLTGFEDEYKKTLTMINLLEINTGNDTMWELIARMYKLTAKTVEDTFEVEDVKGLLRSNEKFDVVIAEQSLVDGLKIFSTIYDAPLIVLATAGANPRVNDVVGNPTPYSYVPSINSDSSPHMSFWERLRNVFIYILVKTIECLYYYPSQDEALRKYYPDAPDIYDLYQNVSLVLLNSHETLNQAVPHVPNMIQIGGFHVKPPKELPKDLQDFLDHAEEGVIFFSLGSNLRSKNLPLHKREALLKAFGKLKEQVLWKWEDEQMPGKPENVKLGKWLPQQSVLDKEIMKLPHPNVKLFITHSGLLSTTEAVYHGVPILAIPVFGDQHINAKLAVQSGYALALPYADPSFSEEELSKKLNELLTNPKYRENAKKISRLFHDRPMKPMDTAVYWVEYVIRNRGAPHLKVAGANLPWYIYHSLDVVSFLLVVSTLLVYVSYLSLRKILSCWDICKSTKKKTKQE